MIRSIPEDLTIEILQRMPAKSVLRCRCLSKRYRKLIDSPYFIRKHYDLSLKTRPNTMLIRRTVLRKKDNFINNSGRIVEVLVEMDSSMSVAKFINDLAPPAVGRSATAYFVGFYRGIFCYNLIDRFCLRLAFRNPYTGVHRESEHSLRIGISSFLSLLGYDAIADDLKVLVIVQYPGEGEEAIYACIVYSSNTDSWRKTEGFCSNRFRLEKPRFMSSHVGVFVEGTNRVHLFAENTMYGTRSKGVLAFDFAAEKFSSIPLPKHRGEFDESAMLSCFDGCLCFHHRISGCLELDVWVMKEYGVEESWARVFSLQKTVPQYFTYLNHDGIRKRVISDITREFLMHTAPFEELEGEFRILQPHLDMTVLHLDPRCFLSTPTHRKP